MKINLLLVGCLLALCGCGTPEPCRYYNSLQVAEFNGNGPHTKKPYGAVVPYYSEEEVKQAYEPIGFMSYEGDMSEESGILKAMLYRAADLGADGILLNAKGIGREKVTTEQMSEQNVNMTYRWGWMTLVGGRQNRYVYRAQAIRFKKAN